VDVLGETMERGFTLRRKQFREYWRARHDHVVVVSYPKSGRTWHRVAVAQYLRQLAGHFDGTSIDTRKLALELDLPSISYTHNGANFLYAIDASHPLNASPRIWRGRNIILLVRDPRDILVSSYLHAKYRTRTFHGSQSEFVRHPYTGIEKILVTYNRWNDNRRLATRCIVQRYEDMHDDLARVLTETIELAGYPKHDKALRDAVAFSQIDNMRNLERDGYFESRAMRSDNGVGRAESRKVREGRVGGFADHLSPEDLAYIDEATARIGNPFAR
jgi:hypothetical protein